MSVSRPSALSAPAGSSPELVDSDDDLLSGLLPPVQSSTIPATAISLQAMHRAVYPGSSTAGKTDAQRTLAVAICLPHDDSSPHKITEDMNEERSSNSSETLDAFSPASSSPELEAKGETMFNATRINSSIDYDLTSSSSPARVIPWLKKPSATSVQPPAPDSLELFDEDTGFGGEDFPVTSSQVPESEEVRPGTPLVPEIEEEEPNEDAKRLQQAILDSLAGLRAAPMALRGILKTPMNTPANTQQESQPIPRISIQSEDSPDTGLCVKSKKSVRWQLSQEQEQKEVLLSLPPSPMVIHKSNRIIWKDESEDELMSVCSDDYPTPPLSPQLFDLQTTPPTSPTPEQSSAPLLPSVRFLPSLTPPSSPDKHSGPSFSALGQPSNLPQSAFTPSSQSNEVCNISNASKAPVYLPVKANGLESSEEDRPLASAALALPLSHGPLSRTTSSLSRTTSTSFITRGSALSTSRNDKRPAIQSTALDDRPPSSNAGLRSASDASSSLASRNLKKRPRVDTDVHNDEDAVVSRGSRTPKIARIQ